MTTMRLAKALQNAGIASRRKTEEIILEGRVKVNGKVCLIPQTSVDPEKDMIFFDGKKLGAQEAKVYYLLNKPKRMICTAAPSHSKRVIDLFQEVPYRLFTVGRLDKDTTGLLIVTNDGDFANRIIHPAKNIEKEYLAKVAKDVSGEDLIALSKGGFIEGSFVKPKSVKKIRRGTVKIVVMEGKKHEVRALFEKAGLEILSLSRIRIGSLILGQLAEGTYRPLKEREKELIFE
jgi:23S rRNA pseudouridine2605 synthase